MGVKEIARWERDFGGGRVPFWERSTGRAKGIGNLSKALKLNYRFTIFVYCKFPFADILSI